MKISIPDAALPYLLLQRTDYLILPRWRLLFRVVARLSHRPPVMTAVALESRLRKRAVGRSFARDMQREYAAMRGWLPAQASAILDIGCGLGGIDVLLFEHYRRDPGLRFYLLDRTQTDESIEYGFKVEADFYNSLELTGELLASNGLPSDALHLVQARDDNRLDVPEQVDLIVSLISWGFHYPVHDYLGQAYDLLKPSGRLILDVRRGTDGLAQIEDKFGDTQVISEHEKGIRVAATR